MITLKEIVEKQKELDRYLEEQKKPRPRTVVDILGSMLAETVELEEELPYELSHKTWKKKEWNAENQFLECVDIFFFIVQLIKEKEEIYIEAVENVLLDECQYKKNIIESLADLQSVITGIRAESFYQDCTYNEIIIEYRRLFNSLGYTYDEIKQGYMKKWEVNMNREDFKGNKND